MNLYRIEIRPAIATASEKVETWSMCAAGETAVFALRTALRDCRSQIFNAEVLVGVTLLAADNELIGCKIVDEEND